MKLGEIMYDVAVLNMLLLISWTLSKGYYPEFTSLEYWGISLAVLIIVGWKAFNKRDKS